jgi:hypothetical protein
MGEYVIAQIKYNENSNYPDDRARCSFLYTVFGIGLDYRMYGINQRKQGGRVNIEILQRDGRSWT